MTKRVTVHLTDGSDAVHTYPYEVAVRDGVLVVWMDNGDKSVKYPLTSIRSWETER